MARRAFRETRSGSTQLAWYKHRPFTQATRSGWLGLPSWTGSRQGHRPRQCRKTVAYWLLEQPLCTDAKLREAMSWSRHCHRSDGSSDVNKPSGWGGFQFSPARVMMSGVYWFWSRRDRWASTIGNPTVQVPASADPLGRNHPRRAPAPMRTPSLPTGWSLISPSGFCPFSSLTRLRRIFPGGFRLRVNRRMVAACLFSPTHNHRRLYQLWCTLVPQYLRPTFPQEARRMPHWRHWCVLNTRPSPVWDSVWRRSGKNLTAELQ